MGYKSLVDVEAVHGTSIDTLLSGTSINLSSSLLFVILSGVTTVLNSNSSRLALLSSMLTTADMVGLDADTTFVHRKAMLIATKASSLLNSVPSLESTSPIIFPCSFKALA
nr:hypothetical protein B296_00019203 [Ipomoea batatas]GME15641.1 hypothetical protein B296_00019203 [Ipomoea batatas]